MDASGPEPGYEQFCEDCDSCMAIVDENGTSYECLDEDNCERIKEADE